MHAGGANVLYGDGHVQFASEAVDRQVWRELGSRVALSETRSSF
jgi:prepilin-type processing-associated H-X9-DG protein